MGIANLTRYNLCNVNDDGPVILAMEAESDGEYVKFEEAMEASSNSLQQLKAEIAALVNNFCEMYSGCLRSEAVSRLLEKLRQLSAV